MPSLGLCKACVENGRAAGRATAVSRVKAEIVLVGTHPVQYPSVAHGWGWATTVFRVKPYLLPVLASTIQLTLLSKTHYLGDVLN
jgi:hypothetical protein